MKQLISHSTISLYRLSTIRWFVFIVSNKWTQWQLAGFHLFVIRILVDEGFVVVVVDMFGEENERTVERERDITSVSSRKQKFGYIHYGELDWAIILRDNGFLNRYWILIVSSITRLWTKRNKNEMKMAKRFFLKAIGSKSMGAICFW